MGEERAHGEAKTLMKITHGFITGLGSLLSPRAEPCATHCTASFGKDQD